MSTTAEPTVNEQEPAVCAYSARHALDQVPATTVLDCRPVGMVPACQQCADFYHRVSQPRGT